MSRIGPGHLHIVPAADRSDINQTGTSELQVTPGTPDTTAEALAEHNQPLVRTDKATLARTGKKPESRPGRRRQPAARPYGRDPTAALAAATPLCGG